VRVVHYSIVGILASVPQWYVPRSGRSHDRLARELADFVLFGISAGLP
jgi:hypothetical protein